MRLHFPAKDVTALAVVTLLSALANLPEGYGSWLISRNTLLGALVAVVVIALFHFLRAFLLLCITTLAIGANLPRELAEGLGVSQGAMLMTLAALIGITLLNRRFELVPLNLGEDETAPLEETVLVDVATPQERMVQAIAHGRIGALRQLIAEHSDVNFKVNGATPLHVATEKGYSAIVELLIAAGANPLAQNREGETPLDVALALKKYAKTTDILYKATIPLLTPQEV